MSTATRALILLHWQLANERNWDAFAALLKSDLRYEVPQTREFIATGAGYLDLFRTWPGDWQAQVQELVCEASKAVCLIRFQVGAEVMAGISIFGIVDGKIAAVTDYWPEPYEPPPRLTVHLRRHPPPV